MTLSSLSSPSRLCAKKDNVSARTGTMVEVLRDVLHVWNAGATCGRPGLGQSTAAMTLPPLYHTSSYRARWATLHAYTMDGLGLQPLADDLCYMVPRTASATVASGMVASRGWLKSLSLTIWAVIVFLIS